MIRIVRWPSARCWRTRRMPSGNDFVMITWANNSRASALDLLDRGVLVAAVEVAQEVGAIGPVELEQARCLGDRAQEVAHPLGRVEAAGREPRVALDDVRGDQRVLEVEGDDLTLGVEHLLAHARHAVASTATARAWS